MMDHLHQKLFILIVIFTIFGAVTSLECFQCAGYDDSECRDPFGVYDGSMDNCHETQQACIKHTSKSSKDKYILRGCGVVDYCSKLDSSAGYEHCSECQNDLCNHTSYNQPAILLIAMFCFICCCLYYKY